MRSLNEFTSVYLHRDPVDMRRGINGLCELVSVSGMGDLMKAHLFVFCGRRRDRIKILYFDRSGFCLWQKRLERDKFSWPRKSENDVVILSPTQLSWLLDGFDILKMKPFAELQYSILA